MQSAKLEDLSFASFCPAPVVDDMTIVCCGYFSFNRLSNGQAALNSPTETAWNHIGLMQPAALYFVFSVSGMFPNFCDIPYRARRLSSRNGPTRTAIANITV